MSKVLIIESDAAVARSLADNLGAAGIESQITADGTEGLTLAKSAQPDLIVLCVELARVSGYSICNKLKKDPALASVPLILTSSQATEETFEQHKKLKTRAEGYIKKLYEMSQLLALLGEFVALRAAAPAPAAARPQSSRPAAAASRSVELNLDELGNSGPVASRPAAPAPRRPTADALGLD